MPKQTKSSSGYTAESISVLEGLEPVRMRPGMYIGTTGIDGLHHLIWEVVDNAIDEALGGHCHTIWVRMLDGNRIQVEDDGRGIPVDYHKQYKTSALELVLTKLHAGGKFDHHAYKVSGGLHGVGVSVVNALSTWLKAEVHREGKIHVQEYKLGKPLKPVKAIGSTKKRGTIITFEPDPSIFPITTFSWTTICDHLRQQAYLTAGITITIEDQRTNRDQGSQPIYSFYFEGGTMAYVRHLNLHRTKKHDTIFHMTKEMDTIVVDVALQYTDEYQETIRTFANNITNPEGGTHLMGFRSALTRALNSYARTKGYLKEKDENLTGEDVREGLTAIISVKVPNPQFEGQTKAKLGNPEVRTVVETTFSEAFQTFLEEHPVDSEQIIQKSLLASRARLAARAARETVLRKGALEGLMLPGKLADCSSRQREECELFIVEGESAGGSAKQGRNRRFQAILPLKGKILNVERARLDKLLSNEELKSLIIAMGTNIGEQFSTEHLRYNRIIIMTDADVDGAHIRTLLLTLFYRHFRPLIEERHIFIAQPPLYRVSHGSRGEYVYDDKALTDILADIKKQSKQPAPQVNIQRYKGLGEMNPEQLWQTTMDPTVRRLVRVTIEDAEKADEVFSVLMGADVAPRKHFIQTHAKSVQNLDI